MLTLLYGKYVRADGIAEFGERACARGSLGVLPATDVMPIALANAQRPSLAPGLFNVGYCFISVE